MTTSVWMIIAGLLGGLGAYFMMDVVKDNAVECPRCICICDGEVAQLEILERKGGEED